MKRSAGGAPIAVHARRIAWPNGTVTTRDARGRERNRGVCYTRPTRHGLRRRKERAVASECHGEETSPAAEARIAQSRPGPHVVRVQTDNAERKAQGPVRLQKNGSDSTVSSDHASCDVRRLSRENVWHAHRVSICCERPVGLWTQRRLRQITRRARTEVVDPSNAAVEELVLPERIGVQARTGPDESHFSMTSDTSVDPVARFDDQPRRK